MAKVPWGRETMAGLAGAIGSVPDGMATAVLAGANPMAGLYASSAGPVELSSVAARSLKKFDATHRLRIAGAIELLSVEPRPLGATLLRGGERGRWRVRVGDHRVVYTIEDDRLIVLVLRIAHRREVYDR